MREQEIELLKYIIDFNAMEASPRLIEAQESLIKQVFEIQQKQLGTFSPDFLENPIVTSFYKANQIGLLQDRLKKIPDASVTNPFDTLITTNNSNQLTVPTPTNQSKKRKTSPEVKSSRGKKQRTEVIESELSNLVKQMPSLLSRQTHFCVEQAVGQNLQKSSKTTQDKLGIGSIRKVRNQTQYKVEISDPSKYRDAYNKYTAPLFVTAANTNNPLYSQNQSTELLNYNAMESNHKIDDLHQ